MNLTSVRKARVRTEAEELQEWIIDDLAEPSNDLGSTFIIYFICFFETSFPGTLDPPASPPASPPHHRNCVYHQDQLTLTSDETRNVRVLSRETCDLLF